MKKRLIFGSCADVKAVRILSVIKKRPEKKTPLYFKYMYFILSATKPDFCAKEPPLQIHPDSVLEK